MGGRGKASGVNKQLDINSYQHKLEIKDIMHNADIARELLNCIEKSHLKPIYIKNVIVVKNIKY